AICARWDRWVSHLDSHTARGRKRDSRLLQFVTRQVVVRMERDDQGYSHRKCETEQENGLPPNIHLKLRENSSGFLSPLDAR
ncbi:MAG: hypothetical protein ACRD34_16960, partial [Bryobacteraceae bacterium]